MAQCGERNTCLLISCVDLTNDFTGLRSRISLTWGPCDDGDLCSQRKSEYASIFLCKRTTNLVDHVESLLALLWPLYALSLRRQMLAVGWL